jgi:hypothetical protein
MENQRAKVLGIAFAMLALASTIQIYREGAVDANAWALLSLSVLFAISGVIAFFQAEEVEHVTGTQLRTDSGDSGEAQNLPDPAEAGFDVPVF